MAKLNISIDDVSPHPLSSIKVTDRCFELISIYPDIKFTLFVPVAYWRTRAEGMISTKKPLILSEFPDFCSSLQKLPKKNFEIGYHGYYHGVPGHTDNDEFAALSYEDALEKFELMSSVVESSGLKDVFSPLFRPPAWRMSPGSFQASFDSGITHLAIFPKKLGTQADSYKGEDKKDKYNTSYASCFPPIKDLCLEAETNIVYHACEWDKNYLSQALTDQLHQFIKNNKKKIVFKFLHS